MFDVKEKIAIVTGGASGIGLATAKMLLEKGAKVAIADYNSDAVAKETASLKETYSENVIGLTVDVSNEAAVKKLVDDVVEEFGRLDIMVNNAGISGNSKMITGDDESINDFKRIFDINVNGVIYGGKYASEQMIKQGEGGAIVNTSSMMGVIGTNIGGTGYCGSKHAVLGITKAWALELAPHNIRVNALCPGYTVTGMLNPEIVGQEFFDWAMSLHPLAAAVKRIANADEMAHAILFMIENTFLTGQHVTIDGGYTIQ